MNHAHYSPSHREALEARLARRLTARLTEQADDLPSDFSERLRVAREQAVARARARRPAVAVATATQQAGGGSLALRGPHEHTPWWGSLASVLPVLLLLTGLVLIQYWNTHRQIAAAADIDVTLLTDDLPLAAYSDPGFVEFLQSPDAPVQ